MNRDGVEDLLISTGSSVGSVRVISGKDRKTLLMRITPRDPTDGLGDVNGDGHGDLIVGSARAFDPSGVATGSARILSGKTGKVLRVVYGTVKNGWFGRAAAHAGDVNKDGVSDFVVGALPPSGGTGVVKVFSGKDGSMIHNLPNDGLILSQRVGGAVDVNADGHADIMVGAFISSRPSRVWCVYARERTGKCSSS